jgi:hypothetical protein
MGDTMTDPYADHPLLGRRVRAVRDQISEPAYDLILMLAELEGNAPECSAERAEIFRYVWSLPAYDKRARAKVWAEAPGT